MTPEELRDLCTDGAARGAARTHHSTGGDEELASIWSLMPEELRPTAMRLLRLMLDGGAAAVAVSPSSRELPAQCEPEYMIGLRARHAGCLVIVKAGDHRFAVDHDAEAVVRLTGAEVACEGRPAVEIRPEGWQAVLQMLCRNGVRVLELDTVHQDEPDPLDRESKEAEHE